MTQSAFFNDNIRTGRHECRNLERKDISGQDKLPHRTTELKNVAFTLGNQSGNIPRKME
jgi:hypothetical protein